MRPFTFAFYDKYRAIVKIRLAYDVESLLLDPIKCRELCKCVATSQWGDLTSYATILNSDKHTIVRCVNKESRGYVLVSNEKLLHIKAHISYTDYIVDWVMPEFYVYVFNGAIDWCLLYFLSGSFVRDKMADDWIQFNHTSSIDTRDKFYKHAEDIGLRYRTALRNKLRPIIN